MKTSSGVLVRVNILIKLASYPLIGTIEMVGVIRKVTKSKFSDFLICSKKPVRKNPFPNF